MVEVMLSRLPTRCKHCREKFSAEDKALHRRIHPACIPAYADAQEARATRKAEKQARMAAKVEKALDRKKRAEQKPRSEWHEEAQRAVNAWVRERDRDLPCISCGKPPQLGDQAGHYRSRGAAKHLALDPRNIHRQCVACNLHKHSNAIEYRIRLVERFGVEFVEAIEADQTPRKYTIEELIAIKAEYVAKLNELKRSRG